MLSDYLKEASVKNFQGWIKNASASLFIIKKSFLRKATMQITWTIMIIFHKMIIWILRCVSKVGVEIYP